MHQMNNIIPIARNEYEVSLTHETTMIYRRLQAPQHRGRRLEKRGRSALQEVKKTYNLLLASPSMTELLYLILPSSLQDYYYYYYYWLAAVLLGQFDNIL